MNLRIAFITLAFLSLSLSQLSSYLIYANLAIGETLHILSFLDFTHIRNHGGVFGSFQGKGWLFAIVSVVILGGLVIYVLSSKSLKKYEYICFGIILGAGASNILDRLIYGSVIDFIHVKGIPYWHYIFNTADTLIHVGVWPIVLFSILEIKKEKSTHSEN